MSPTVSVVVVTYGRPDSVRECLTHLARLRTAPLEVIVVDATPADTTRRLVRGEFPEVRLLHSTLGRGTTPESRQMGFAVTRGDVVAFIDDDAYVAPDWLDELVAPYEDPAVVAVGGRADNGIPGEESEGLGRIGRLLPDGRLTGHFGADPGRVIEVDHLLGANMSFRRSALAAIGGIRGNYPGTCLCEESDISLRLRATGGTLLFTPRAVVRHVAAPYGIGGKRFDRRYLYYLRRNHVVMLVRNFGWRDPLARRYVRTALRAQHAYLHEARRRLGSVKEDGTRRPLRKRAKSVIVLTRAVAELAGLAAGVPAAAVARRRDVRAGVATPALAG
ncbi:glycosyltransferase family 2 protein [Cellulosimicrobium protaetiae]|uniref:Glycosyltransferase family 2 protein n=1 Tax=Cellulosimicrobium protaetiae TaxID=2587808 RepID=A0A6M5UD72_9MICO|nr:glycosyltransferase [Cellulosimicrobium protaetiae]QJW35984.1 glycosyltransferase family 2 protein [Cellulosimicrobium protaetiae]